MSEKIEQLQEAVNSALGERFVSSYLAYGELTLEITPENLVEVATLVRDQLGFGQLIDLCGVDYSQYGKDEWKTNSASGSGFSRGVDGASSPGRLRFGDELEAVSESGRRFAATTRADAPGARRRRAAGRRAPGRPWCRGARRRARHRPRRAPPRAYSDGPTSRPAPAA